VTIAVADEDVARAIDEWIAGDRHQGSVVGLRRRPWEYSTSAPLEFVTAVMDDGREHNLVLKYLGPADTTEKARRVKPSFVIDPRREIEVYRRLLAPLQIGPSLVGSNIDLTSDSYWLLLEHVDGPRLTDVGELTAWAASARWLGALHARSGADGRRAVAPRGGADGVRSRMVPGVDGSGPPVLRLGRPVAVTSRQERASVARRAV
jgi:hypothetical protein